MKNVLIVIKFSFFKILKRFRTLYNVDAGLNASVGISKKEDVRCFSFQNFSFMQIQS